MFKRTVFQQTRLLSFSSSTLQRRPALITVQKLKALSSLQLRVASQLRTYSATATGSTPKSSPTPPPPESQPQQETKETEKEIGKETQDDGEVISVLKKKQNEELAKELEAKVKETKAFKDKYTQAVADFRNLQDRMERERKSARDFAIQKFAKDLVDSVDNLDRALKAVPEDVRNNIEKNNKDLVELYNGLKLTESILLNTLKKHGLEKIHPMGEVFDPNRHEATFQVPMPDKDPNTIFHVQQTGFLLNGRTIRAAKVGVVAQPSA